MNELLEPSAIRGLITYLITVVTVAFALVMVVRSLWASKADWQEAKLRLSEAESKAETQPEKAKPAWDLARVTLEAYFNRNLSQIASIYWLSVFVMLAGFALIAWGATQAVMLNSLATPSLITSIAGVVTEFIGATFLFVYKSTIQQAATYSQTLERINSVGMAMQILDTMPDEAKPDDLKSQTKALLVELLVRQAHSLESNRQKTTAKRVGKKRKLTSIPVKKDEAKAP